MIAILLIAVFVLVITVLWMKKNKKNGQSKEIDYRAFFFLGITFLSLGSVFTFAIDNPGFIGFMGLGIAYIAISLVNKDKWKKEE
jgi:hypothetical protein